MKKNYCIKKFNESDNFKFLLSKLSGFNSIPYFLQYYLWKNRETVSGSFRFTDNSVLSIKTTNGRLDEISSDSGDYVKYKYVVNPNGELTKVILEHSSSKADNIDLILFTKKGIELRRQDNTVIKGTIDEENNIVFKDEFEIRYCWMFRGSVKYIDFEDGGHEELFTSSNHFVMTGDEYSPTKGVNTVDEIHPGRYYLLQRDTINHTISASLITEDPGHQKVKHEYNVSEFTKSKTFSLFLTLTALELANIPRHRIINILIQKEQLNKISRLEKEMIIGDRDKVKISLSEGLLSEIKVESGSEGVTRGIKLVPNKKEGYIEFKVLTDKEKDQYSTKLLLFLTRTGIALIDMLEPTRNYMVVPGIFKIIGEDYKRLLYSTGSILVSDSIKSTIKISSEEMVECYKMSPTIYSTVLREVGPDKYEVISEGTRKTGEIVRSSTTKVTGHKLTKVIDDNIEIKDLIRTMEGTISDLSESLKRVKELLNDK